MDKGTHVILTGYTGDLKFLNNKIGKIIDVCYKNNKPDRIRMIFDEPVYQPQPIKAEIVIWSTELSYVLEFYRTPIKVGRYPIIVGRTPITEEVNK